MFFNDSDVIDDDAIDNMISSLTTYLKLQSLMSPKFLLYFTILLSTTAI